MKRDKLIITPVVVVIVVALVVGIGLPALLRAMGLHPEYRGQRYLLPDGRALIVCTSHDRLGEDGDPTGGWGAAYDLGFSKVLGRRITEAYAAGKVVGGVCHGPLGLLLARDGGECLEALSPCSTS
jgi:hypothetical protein